MAIQLDPNLSPDELAKQVESFTNSQVTEWYLQVRSAFRELQRRAIRVSRGSGGHQHPTNRMFWASVLFTRLVVISKSIAQLAPLPKPLEHWDCSSLASLVRNLTECYFVYFWLCEDQVLDVVRDGRFILLNLQDHGSRRKMLQGDQAAFPPIDDPVFDDLLAKFEANSYLRALPEKRKRRFLKGDRSPFLQDDLLERMGVNKTQFRMQYRFMSQHTHTGPIAFYRMVEHRRGVGFETRQEKIYSAMYLALGADVIHRATEGHLTIFPDAETRAEHVTNSQIRRNVERDEGRQRGAKHGA